MREKDVGVQGFLGEVLVGIALQPQGELLTVARDPGPVILSPALLHRRLSPPGLHRTRTAGRTTGRQPFITLAKTSGLEAATE